MTKLLTFTDIEGRHTQACHDNIVKLEAARKEFVALYPNFCRACNASGFVSWVENGAPRGEGFWAMPMSEACVCIAHGFCPRCGELIYEHDTPESDLFDHWFEKEGFCPHCHWQFGKNTDDYAPNEPECYCYEIEADESVAIRTADYRDKEVI